MKAVKKIEISVLHKRITPIVYAVQGDTGREIECTVVDWDIPAGVTARVWVVKPSKKVVYNDCRIVDKSTFVPLTNQTLAEPGGAICMIEFVSGEDVVSSFSFNLYVYESASGDGIPSENESTVLEGMFEELAQDAINTLNEAKAQAAAAKKSAQDTEKIKNDFTLTAQQAVADVNNAGQTQTQRVNEAGDTQVSRIQAEGTTQVKNVQTAAAEITADRTQIHTNRDNTAQLQRTTASAIIREAAGSFLTLEDAAEGKGYRKLDVQGMTVQDGVPEPEAEAPLKNVGVLNPKTGKYEVKVTSCKNNLLDMTGAKGGTAAGITTVVNPDGTLTSNGTGTGGPVAIWLLGGYRPVTTDNVLFTLQAGKTYYISDVVLYMGTDRTAQNKLFVDPAKYPEGFKVTGVRHAQIDSGTVLTNKVYHPRVILGDTDTGWEPYRGHTATITSDRPLTQWDKLTCRDGVWGWAYGGSTTVYDGSNDETWTLQSINGNGIANFQITLNGAVSNFDSPNMCSHFTHQTEAIANVTQPGFLISNSTGKSILYIKIPSTTASTVETFKIWLAEHIMTVQYQTDTETWVPLTAQEQAAMNALCTYAGTTHIWTDDPLHPVISLDYTLDTEGYIRNVVVKNLQLDIAEQITDLQAQIDQLTINNNL